MKVFISSTSLDLAPYRQAAIHACLEAGLHPIAMEFFEAMGVGASTGSCRKLEETNLYLGFFAHRYGFIENGADRSVTEIEFDHAGTLGLERLCFLVDPDYPWPPRQIDVVQLDRLEKFKARINQSLIRGLFTTVEDLHGQVLRSLLRWKEERGGQPSPSAPPALVPHQIPTAPPDFVGREALLDQLAERIERGATISGVHGLGGIGKTSLALKLAERLTEDYPDGQVYLDLEGVDPRPLTPEEAMAHVIRSYQPQCRLPEDPAVLVGHYRSVLHGLRVLLLMDNAAGAAQVRPLLPPAGCILLVTSRFRFSLPGLSSHDLDELSPRDAGQLLHSIAPRIGLAAPAIAERCGYLPLALRLAGSALAERPDLKPDLYLKRLREARDRLTELDRGVPEGIAASIGLSEALLPQSLRTNWRGLAVLAGAFDAEAAAAVWELDSDPAFDALGTLVKSSLLAWDDATSGYRLHDLVREYASARLTDTERDTFQRRHARHFLGIVGRAHDLYHQAGEALVEGLVLFDAAWSNIQAGFAWARGQVGDPSSDRLCCEYAVRAMNYLWLRQSAAEQVQWFEIAVEAARRIDDASLEGGALNGLGVAYRDVNDVRRAIDCLQRRRDLARRLNDSQGETDALGNLGTVYIGLCDYERARGCCKRVLAIARDSGDQRTEANAQGNLAIVSLCLGDLCRAVERAEAFRQLTRDTGDRPGEGIAAGILGAVLFALGQTRRAGELMEDSLAIARETGSRQREGEALGNLSEVHAQLGDAEQAVVLAGQSLAIARTTSHKENEASALGNLCEALRRRGQLQQAIECGQEALALARTVGARRAEALFLGSLAEVHHLNGETDRAREVSQQALEIARAIGDKQTVANVSGKLGEMFEKEGDFVQAIEWLTVRLEYRRSVGHAETAADVARINRLRSLISS